MRNLRLSSRVRKVFQGRSRGLTLVELVIAMAFIGIIAVALLGGLSNAIMSLVVADVRTTAESLARSEMEYVKSQTYEDAPWDYEYDPPAYDGYAVDVSAEPLNDPDDGLQEIAVTVIHGAKEIVTLVGYKVNRDV